MPTLRDGSHVAIAILLLGTSFAGLRQARADLDSALGSVEEVYRPTHAFIEKLQQRAYERHMAAMPVEPSGAAAVTSDTMDTSQQAAAAAAAAAAVAGALTESMPEDASFEPPAVAMPTHAFIHGMQQRAYERHVAAVGSKDVTAAQYVSRDLAGTAQASTPAEIRIFTSYDSSVSLLSPTNQALVKSTVNTAVLVLKKFYKVNAPLSSPLVVSPPTNCATGCTVSTCPAGTPTFYSVPNILTNGTGQANTDLYIVVMASLSDQCTDTIAWAFSCFFDPATGRPIQGYVNVCNLFFNDNQFAPPLKTRVSTIVHEITHALGFTSKFLFKVPREVLSTTDAYGDVVHVVNSTRVAAATRTFFGCPTADGAQLEDQGGAGSVDSHWDYRIFQGELMCPSGGYLLSNFTLSAMADLGWYTPRYQFAAPFVRGMGSGCALLTDTCSAVLANLADQDFYCTASGSGTCVDTWSKASCSSNGYLFNKPVTCQVTQNYGPAKGDDCRTSTNAYPFDYMSSGSTCMTTLYQSRTVGGCYDTVCTAGGALLIVAHPSGGPAINVSCPTGGSVDLYTQANAAYSQHTVVTCPDNAAVCATRRCNPGCNTTNGQCINGSCVCYLEWIGVDCNLNVAQWVGSFDSYRAILPPSPPPAQSPPPNAAPSPPPPLLSLDPTKAQYQVKIQAILAMNYVMLPAGSTNSRHLLAATISTASTTTSRQLLAVTTSMLSFKADFVSAIATLLQIPQANVNITSVTGTDQQATVTFTVLPNALTRDAATAAIAVFISNPYGGLGAALVSRYGVTGASAVVLSYSLVILSPTPDPPPSPSLPAAASPPEDAKALPLLIIIVVSVAGVFLIALLVVLLWWCTRPKPAQVHTQVIQVKPSGNTQVAVRAPAAVPNAPSYPY